MAWIGVTVGEAGMDCAAALAQLQAASGEVGAVASFLGVVRASERDGCISALHIEHYPAMTEPAIAAMAREACSRFGLIAARVVHRVGHLAVGEPIVFVGTAACHRRAAFEGCEFLMDYLKTQAPFWKKAVRADGSSQWVAAAERDDAALARWGVDTGQAGNAGASRPGV